MHFLLPPELSRRIAQLAEGIARKDLAAAAGRQSAAYRAGVGSRGLAGRHDMAAYLTARLPATYAAARAALARAAAAVPHWQPQSMIDFGAGPGTAAHAAAATWPGLSAATLIDRNPDLLAMARILGAQLLPNARFRQGDLWDIADRADLVIASYVLAEAPEQEAAAMARALWAATTGMLVLIEPGTPAGFARLGAARQALIAAGASVAAPCTHEEACPLAPGDWCHFSQRLARSRGHMAAKQARVPFEDERYAYLAVTRFGLERPAGAARILRAPIAAKPGITLTLCAADGTRQHAIARRDKEGFARARRLGWGDAFLP